MDDSRTGVAQVPCLLDDNGDPSPDHDALAAQSIVHSEEMPPTADQRELESSAHEAERSVAWCPIEPQPWVRRLWASMCGTSHWAMQHLTWGDLAHRVRAGLRMCWATPRLDFVRWLWREHRWLLFAWMSASALPVIVGGGVIIYQVHFWEEVSWNIDKARWRNEQGKRGHQSFSLLHWRLVLAACAVVTVVSLQILPRLLICPTSQGAQDEADVEAGASQHNSREPLLPPALKRSPSPQVAPGPSVTSDAAVSSPAGLLASSAEQPPASGGTMSDRGGLLSDGQPPGATLGMLPFRQGWALFGRVTAASLAHEQPSPSFFMDPQPAGVLPAYMEGSPEQQEQPGRWAGAYSIIRYLLHQGDWRSLCMALALLTSAFAWLMLGINWGVQLQLDALGPLMTGNPVSTAMDASVKVALVAVWIYGATGRNSEHVPRHHSDVVNDVARPALPERSLRDDVLGHLHAIWTAPYRQDLWVLGRTLCGLPLDDSDDDASVESGGLQVEGVTTGLPTQPLLLAP
mmetsp:Transcript_6034/g.17270  ORF Transcript_6034/g.17270 Transcript_6034/m.17270 type:complete len:517 (-) Transcript_6034:484-2034(-)